MENKNLLIASNNKHKIREIKEILKNKFDNIFSLQEMGIDVDVEETGLTFEENAIIKAREIAKISNMVTLADDSGLEVYALNNEPGVYSARYAGVPCNDYNNNELLLKNLASQIDRRARFVSVVALYYNESKIITATGFCEGEILSEYRGENGFGYDPLFLSYDLNLTFAEATEQEKNGISHRAKALKILFEKIL